MMSPMTHRLLINSGTDGDDDGQHAACCCVQRAHLYSHEVTGCCTQTSIIQKASNYDTRPAFESDRLFLINNSCK